MSLEIPTKQVTARPTRGACSVNATEGKSQCLRLLCLISVGIGHGDSQLNTNP